ncbi:unnamed protein product (macronuclear) [Paramecium tetraurelia]|uniref:Transmembrane protein n=1 Tax=Paramecium tetraurelia TaxID=5888 RepID=A0BK87_PARTE|nr:uncharacterized protein GSPATT00029584001 [Paramecium tetraurelia]CAK58954.1 unnamed protein product [Paramecium tetraurelia]|eukprot:XP_001426352.1 hypothetical protein (macronuclear) [Paramecium tetraurelia strain d4-2]
MPNIMEKFSKGLLNLKNEFMYQLDIFGQLPSFTVLNRNKYTSQLGFVMSLLIGTLSIYYLINEVQQMLSKSKPSIYSSEIQVIETDSFYLNNENFTLAITIADRFSEPVIGINRYFNISVSQCDRVRIRDQSTGNITVQLNCNEMPLEPCNMSHFTTDLQIEYFKTIRFGAVQCINREYQQKNPPVLKGLFNALEYKYLYIQFTACLNSSTYQGCAPQEEIEEVLQAGRYNVYKSDYISQLDQPGKPYKQIITNDFSGFSYSTSKTIVQSYRIVQTITDQGMILEDENVEQNIQQTEWREISDFYNHQYLVLHVIKLDFKQTNNFRTYIKLQTILGKLGGILQIFMMVVTIIFKPVIDNMMKLELANSLYRFQDSSEKQNQRSTQLQINQSEREFSPPNSLKKIEGQNSQKNEKLNKSMFETFLIIFGLQKEKHQQFLKARKKIIKNLDIVTILKRLQEIDMLKRILFSKEQMEIIKNLPKPLIDQKQFITQNLIENDIEQDKANQINLSPLQSQQSRLNYFPKMNTVLQKQQIDTQLQLYLDHCNDSQKLKVKLQNSLLKSPSSPLSNSQIKCDDIDEPVAQKPKK